jgi:hypothetical protein
MWLSMRGLCGHGCFRACRCGCGGCGRALVLRIESKLNRHASCNSDKRRTDDDTHLQSERSQQSFYRYSNYEANES